MSDLKVHWGKFWAAKIYQVVLFGFFVASLFHVTGWFGGSKFLHGLATVYFWVQGSFIALCVISLLFIGLITLGVYDTRKQESDQDTLSLADMLLKRKGNKE